MERPVVVIDLKVRMVFGEASVVFARGLLEKK
jgi:hypothetical protein